MKTLTFLLLAFLISCIVTLKHREQDLKEENKYLKEISLIQDSLINVIQKSNREYIYIALNCNAKHNK